MTKVNIKKLYELFLQSKGVTTDSRNCQSGTIFFALKGASFDGNDYAQQAINAGCSFAVVDSDKDFPDDEQFIKVDNVLKTLQDLATYHRIALNIPILAITGTNGKTTTKELVNSVLRKKYNVICTLGNLNNQIGVPLTLLKMTKEHQIAIIEMGASHPGDIDELCRIARPNYGLVTNVGKAHLAGFGNFEGVIKTKSELYQFLNNNNGTIFINPNNPFLMKAAEKCKNLVYYSGRIFPENGYETLSYRWLNGLIKTHLYGDYNFENVQAAVTIGTRFGINEKDIHAALANYSPSNNRSQLFKTHNNMLILDTYNANPTSMTAAINNFVNAKCDTMKYAILGDMLELGDESIAEHRTIIEKLKTAGLNHIILVGENFCKALKETHIHQNMAPHITCFANRELLIEHLKEEELHNLTILIKGSRGIALEKIVNYL
ncbi:MAG: UDP-N-acetylmuramoyl-tripeptide--D-alanyl-D-alanine ligase [Paludibacteraceae bacterium]|nr:UDP-N-acetylmuramoyl-tripeptide--D-alanyl-D-alanine ligase [Paludibacteraceae bacterium]